MKSKMKMNNFLILLLILFIVLLFLVYYYKYLRKQQFESFQQPKYKTKTFTLTPNNTYIISDFLDCNAEEEKVIYKSSEKGEVTFSTVNVSQNKCKEKTQKKFTYIIDSADLIKLQKDDNVKNITIKIEYRVANEIIEQKNIINIKEINTK